jgi:SAM-dependent methyltransferase
MIGSASSRADVTGIRGVAQAMPLLSATVALVYFHLSIHYGDWRRSVDEAARVLEPEGRCVIWTLGARHHTTSMLARWFPSVAGIDAGRFPEPAQLAARFDAIGHQLDVGTTVEEVRRTAGDWTRAVRAGFVSTLQLVGADELAGGLAAFSAVYPDPAASITYELKWDWICSKRPAG